ncbi:MAG: hypothetical protein ACRD1P_05425 [Thermoanaerobaculia bacterium]
MRRILIAALLVAAASCGGLKTVSKDGYRALLVFTKENRYAIAVRGEKRRVDGVFEGSTLVKILRPDLGKIWQFRPSTKKILEETWSAADELVPGYPLDPHFDSAAYGHRFGGEIRRIDDGTQGMHPCDRYRMTLPSGDHVVLWVARDLERLPVRVEHEKKDANDEYQPFTDAQLLDVRIGADEDLFAKPKGYTSVRSYEELSH